MAGVVTTGYAKDILKEVFSADAALVETVAHAQSALHFYHDPHVIVDVGGQDIKIIVLHDGRVKDFRLNTACSAGNGYFLQAIARSFGYPVEEFAETAFTAREMPVFGQGCVLFLQSEIANVQRQGWKPPEILAGLAAVLPKNVFLYVAKAPNLSRFGTRFVLQGGHAAEPRRGQGAGGLHPRQLPGPVAPAGHRAARALRRGGRDRRRPRGDPARGARAAPRRSSVSTRPTAYLFQARCDEDTRCHFCTNECMRTFVDVSIADDRSIPPGAVTERAVADRRFIVAACEKGAAEDVAEMRDIKAAVDKVKAETPNLVAFAAREVWKPRRPADRRRPPAAGRLAGCTGASAGR